MKLFIFFNLLLVNFQTVCSKVVSLDASNNNNEPSDNTGYNTITENHTENRRPNSKIIASLDLASYQNSVAALDQLGNVSLALRGVSSQVSDVGSSVNASSAVILDTLQDIKRSLPGGGDILSSVQGIGDTLSDVLSAVSDKTTNRSLLNELSTLNRVLGQNMGELIKILGFDD